MNVEILHQFVSPGHDFKGRHGKESLDNGVVDEAEIECVAGSGIRGDRYFDFEKDFKGQITFFDGAVYEAVKEKFDLPDLGAEVFRRNVIVNGVDLNSLIGKRFRIGGVEFEGSEEAAPCYWMDQAAADGAHEFLKGKGGLRARIRVSGALKKGVAELDVVS